MSFNYEPGSTFKVVAVSDGLQQRADHAEHPLQHPRPDRGRQPNDPRRHRTSRRNAHDRRRSSRSRATSARSRSARWTAPNSFNEWVHRYGFGAPHRGRTAGRGNGRGAAAERILGLLDGQPADRPGRARDADADGDRLLRDRQRRHPAPAAHRRRRRRPAPARAGGTPRDLRERRPPRCARC